ncbi:MAG TPA: hypothetical protein VFB35_02615 [Gaiellaceae bacterium]|nr:hypothetical protein [Gaiellaceae bacterium]
MRKLLLVIPLLVLAAWCAPGAGAATTCPAGWRAGWQRLADRVAAPVYCPGWLPDPLTGQIGGKWNIIDSVGKDRSYLVGFAWQEMGQEIHVNLRGYPGRTSIPICRETDFVGGKPKVRHVPCFADARGQRTIGGIRVTVYTVNQDADMWHLLYAWRRQGTLYTLSEHIALPLTYQKVVQNLNRMMGALELVRPRAG